MASLEAINHVDVDLSDKRYSIFIGQRILYHGSLLEDLIKGETVLVVTNQIVAPLYLDIIRERLSGFRCHVVVLADGESHKNLASIVKIHETLIKYQHPRNTTLIALGGGVIGDMTGFAASTYHRGVSYIQIPTTLLAAVDASIGGKTAINYPHAKNVVGSFYQPRGVVIDISFLETLPSREFRAGFGEIIKYVLLSGDRLLLSRPLPELITRCCEIKLKYIQNDIEDNQGLRILLNLGHTIAHALEACTEFNRWLHGEAVAIGLYCAALLSYRRGYLNIETLHDIDQLLLAHQLPRRIPNDLDQEYLYLLIKQDKKVTTSRIPFILMSGMGECFLDSDISESEVRDLLRDATIE